MTLTKQRDGGPAFPRVRIGVGATQSVSEEGMSLRDWFAGQALAATIARADEALPDADQLAKYMYQYADAMLAEREK